MSPEHQQAQPVGRKPRADGVQARERLLSAALRLFVDKGLARTSVRDIAQAADVNVAAIAYYFGDKAGLYRAALYEPLQGDAGVSDAFDAPGLALADALALYMRTSLRPLGQGEAGMLSVRLRFRERYEPTGMLDEETSSRAQMHARLLALLQRHLGLDRPDPELQALSFAIFGLVAYPYFARDKILAAEPSLFAGPGAVDAWSTRLAGYAGALVAFEAARRAGVPDPSHPTSTSQGSTQ